MPDKKILYQNSIQLLDEIRLVEGPVAVSSTLRRHPLLKTFIHSQQMERMDYLEKTIEQ